jgi:hypothetical protein
LFPPHSTPSCLMSLLRDYYTRKILCYMERKVRESLLFKFWNLKGFFVFFICFVRGWAKHLSSMWDMGKECQNVLVLLRMFFSVY